MIRIGRFRILFTTEGSGRAVKWYKVSVGYETKWLRTWKERVRAEAGCRRKAMIRSTIKECITIILLGMACGQIIRLIGDIT